MAGEEFVWAIPDALANTINVVLYIIGALGIFVIIYILFSLVNAFINKKRNNVLDRIAEDVAQIKASLKKR